METKSLKEFMEARIRRCWFWAGIYMTFTGVNIGDYIASGKDPYFKGIVCVALLAAIFLNVRRAMQLRRILRDPLFYLLAVRHDLGMNDDR